jgi:hypothetical protein
MNMRAVVVAAEAHRLMDSRQVVGKMLLNVDE